MGGSEEEREMGKIEERVGMGENEEGREIVEERGEGYGRRKGTGERKRGGGGKGIWEWRGNVGKVGERSRPGMTIKLGNGEGRQWKRY